jgi:hypothetical protein
VYKIKKHAPMMMLASASLLLSCGHGGARGQDGSVASENTSENPWRDSAMVPIASIASFDETATTNARNALEAAGIEFVIEANTLGRPVFVERAKATEAIDTLRKDAGVKGYGIWVNGVEIKRRAK